MFIVGILVAFLIFDIVVSHKITIHNRVCEYDPPEELYRKLKKFLGILTIVWIVGSIILLIGLGAEFDIFGQAAKMWESGGELNRIGSIFLGFFGGIAVFAIGLLMCLATSSLYFLLFTFSVAFYAFYCFSHDYKVNGFCSGFFVLSVVLLFIILLGGTPLAFISL